MGWMSVAIGTVAAFLIDRRAHPIWFGLAVGSAVASFWSWGVMHNYAHGRAAARRQHLLDAFNAQGATREELGSIERVPLALSGSDAQFAPDSWTHLNMLATVGSVVSLIAAFATR